MGEQMSCEICGHSVDQLDVYECGKCGAVFCSAECEDQHQCDDEETEEEDA